MLQVMQNLVGKKFNYLTVIKFSHKDKNKNKYWDVKCDCGEIKKVIGSHLKDGHTKSCGCYRKETAKENNITHGMRYTRFYRIWVAMKWRCSKDFYQHKDYHDIGVRVCDRWKKFENFRDDMLENYNDHIKKHGTKNTSIDRINGYRGYNLSNCRWATPSIQNNNRRKHYDKNAKSKSIPCSC